MNRRHIRVGRGVVVAVALAAALPVALPTSASADPISDQKALVANVTDQLEALEQQSDILAENLVTALDEKTQLDAQVAAAEQKVAEQQAAVEALRGQLSQVAVQAYMGAGTGSSSPMFNSSADVTDSLARDQLARVAMSAGAATTDQYDEAVKQLEAEQQVARRRPRRRPRPRPSRSSPTRRPPTSRPPSTRRPAPTPRRSSAS